MTLFEREQQLAKLQWKKFPVTSDGFVCLVDVMGTDASVCQAARVSYDNDQRFCTACDGSGHVGQALTVHAPCSVCDGSGVVNGSTSAKDRDLIRYLMRHRHTTPFEMVELKFLVRVPMDCWRQWIRHRMANVNEYSTRYTEAIDSRQTTGVDEWRLQATNNKQGSSGILEDWPVGQDVDLEVSQASSCMTPGDYLTAKEAEFHEQVTTLYRQRLQLGIAKEQARKDLPLSTYTEAYWKCDLHNLLHFLALRMDSHAQKEIRDYATTIGEQIVKPLFPVVWEAFEDYRLNAVTLSGPELTVLRRLSEASDKSLQWMQDSVDGATSLSKREKDDLKKKLERMGL